MTAEAVTVVVCMVVAVAVAIVRVAFLGFLVHRLDSNRDLGWLTGWIRGGSVVNNCAACEERRERTRAPKRN